MTLTDICIVDSDDDVFLPVCDRRVLGGLCTCVCVWVRERELCVVYSPSHCLSCLQCIPGFLALTHTHTHTHTKDQATRQAGGL